ncbi:hypothetical protein Taro_022746 [Colocasia esculenta]|uniref:Pectinesterase n=1 Tax=Colocasia esculenta TaxID=4460 RepID=A0A843V692_COLES|nr:hypothetical protein [Colocasia esculenta]
MVTLVFPSLRVIMWPLSASLLLLVLLDLHLLLFCSAGTAASPPTVAPVSPTAACRTSVYPKLCRAVLAPLRFPASHYGFGRYSVKKALKQARRTSKILDNLLFPGGSARSRRIAGGAGAGSALEDCGELARLNTEYLEEVAAELGRGEKALSSLKAADRVRTLMSAVVTNQQTCFDGLEAAAASAASRRGTTPPPNAEMLAPFVNASQLYCVSLELVSSALSPKGRVPGKPPGLNSTQHSQGFPTEGRHLAEVTQPRPLAGVRIRGAVVVAKDGSGDFTTITEAVAFAPNNTDVEDGYFAITVGEGVYEENVVVDKHKKNLILLGAGINRTVVTGNRSFVDGSSTFKSATFAVHGERFIAVNITFENTAGPEKHQAVAVRNSADLSAFYLCSFVGYQDTLYVHSLRQFYRDCDIYGTVDFIFGNAAAVFQNCNIYARQPMADQVNAVTAQGRTHPNQTTGISIHNCTVRAAPDLAADPNATQTYLGRPWKEFSRTVYMQSYLQELIQPAGWLEWNGSFALSTLYYGEFENYGPGANTSGRVQWPAYRLMAGEEASNFTVYNFIGGDAWLPYAIPHSGGLL